MNLLVLGGLVGAALFMPLRAGGQVVVTNGLSRFHLWNGDPTGHVALWNPTDVAQTVLVGKEALWGPQHPIQIASEVEVPPRTRMRLPYRWLEIDSSSQATRLYLSTQIPPQAEQPAPGQIHVHVSTRYAVDLYRGRVTDDLVLEWTPNGIHVTNAGSDFWAGMCFPVIQGDRAERSVASGMLRPGDSRTWTLPERSEGVWLERIDGLVVASLRP